MDDKSHLILPGMAMSFLAILAGLMIFNDVPEGNREIVSGAIGALAGALTVAGAQKATDFFRRNRLPVDEQKP